MKKVVNPETVAHLWANQIQDEARTPGNGNLFFDDDTIYSYGRHFVIAKHVVSARGNNGALFSTRGYSNTTNKQQHIVRMAARHLNKIYVPDAGENKEHNFTAWLRAIKNIAENLKRARKPEKYISQIQALYNQVKIYANFFEYEIPAELTLAGKIENYEQLEVLTAAEREAKAKREAEALERKKVLDAEAILKFKKDLKEWRQFKGRATHYLYKPNCYFTVNQIDVDYLRFNAEKNRVETSQRVEIPAAIAKEFYGLVLDTIKTGGCVDCATKLLDYQVKEINKKFIVVGCHKIEIKEIKALTKKLGW